MLTNKSPNVEFVKSTLHLFINGWQWQISVHVG